VVRSYNICLVVENLYTISFITNRCVICWLQIIK